MSFAQELEMNREAWANCIRLLIGSDATGASILDGGAQQPTIKKSYGEHSGENDPTSNGRPEVVPGDHGSIHPQYQTGI